MGIQNEKKKEFSRESFKWHLKKCQEVHEFFIFLPKHCCGLQKIRNLILALLVVNGQKNTQIKIELHHFKQTLITKFMAVKWPRKMLGAKIKAVHFVCLLSWNERKNERCFWLRASWNKLQTNYLIYFVRLHVHFIYSSHMQRSFFSRISCICFIAFFSENFPSIFWWCIYMHLLSNNLPIHYWHTSD